MPTVLIDADGCPVVDLTIRVCKGHGVPEIGRASCRERV